MARALAGLRNPLNADGLPQASASITSGSLDGSHANGTVYGAETQLWGRSKSSKNLTVHAGVDPVPVDRCQPLHLATMAHNDPRRSPGLRRTEDRSTI